MRAFGKDVGGSDVRVCTSVCHAGSAGGGPGELYLPEGVAVSGSGDVYVADTFNDRVDEFSQVGVCVRAFGKGVGGGVDVCTSSCLRAAWVAARASSTGRRGRGERVGRRLCRGAPNDRASEFSQSGEFVRAFGPGVGAAPYNCTTASGCQAGRRGAPAASCDFPGGVAMSGSGDVYVADTGNNRVSEFSQAGVFVRAFGEDVGGSGVNVCTSSCAAGTAGDGRVSSTSRKGWR